MNTLTEQQILKELQELDPFSQQELLDFLAFLRGRQQLEPTKQPTEVAKKPHRSIRDNPAFGMWADLSGDSREYLNQIRQK
jgi:hypothetical protein